VTNGDAAMNVLRSESEQAIEQIKETPGMKTCQAHEHQARATILMLRWQIAMGDLHMQQQRRVRNLAVVAVIAAVCLGGVSGNAASILQFVRALVG